MDSERLYSAHDFADATGATGLRRAFLLAFTGLQLTFAQWQQSYYSVAPVPAPVAAPAPPPEQPPLPALSATPPARSRRRRTAPDNAASTGAPA